MKLLSKPEWLVEFPFLSQNWQFLTEIQKSFPTLSSYDLQKDWLLFLTQYKKEHSVLNWFKILRHFRQSRLAYIGFMDITPPLDEHINTMHLVSELADCLIQTAYLVCFEEMVEKYGYVLDGNQQKVELLVFALGKLGTKELNYSSDVDLVFFFEGDGISNGKRSLAAADYFIRFGQKLIKLLDYFSPDGQVYRVDMRLRPFGSSGPLACSVAAFQNYLECEGRDWERFAWMRSRQICGDTDNGVKAIIQPFIYRRHLDYQVFDALAAIKSEIAAHAKIEAHNIKLGVGGIRVIEFIVQSLQLVFGGRHNQLRSSEIYPQFEQLTRLNKLETTAAVSIRKTWLILRKVENIIQLVNDQANHSYPDNAVVLKVISEALDYQDWVHASKDIEQLREKINQEFQNLLSTKQEKSELTTNQQLIVGQLLNRFSSSRVPQARVEQANQILCIASKQCDDVPVLTHLADLIKNILSRPAYLLMLLKERNLLKKLIKLLCKQEYFAASLKKHPVLLEQLFDYEEFIVFDEVTLSSKWLTQLQADCDVEQWMEATRFFKNAQQFNLMMAWSDGLIDDELACQQLTVLAKFMLSLVIYFAFKETALKFNEIALSPDQLIVVAYGSAAVGTMHIDSDLDLVFVLDIQSISGSERVFAQKWIRRIIHHLNSQMYNGKLYDLDMQLRPNGNSGALITTCSEFASYQEQEAWLWEHAAMVKSRPVFASKKQHEWHQEIRKQVLTQKRSYREVDEALDKMASKLSETKKTSGHQGEFEILSCVLKHAATNPEIVEHHALDLIRQKLIELNLISADQINLLAQKKGPIR